MVTYQVMTFGTATTPPSIKPVTQQQFTSQFTYTPPTFNQQQVTNIVNTLKFTPPSFNIPKYDSATMQKTLQTNIQNTMTLAKTLLEQQQTKLITPEIKSLENISTRVGDLITNTIKQINILTTTDMKSPEIKALTTLLYSLTTNLDKIKFEGEKLDVEQIITRISDNGRNLITSTTDNMNKLLTKMNDAELALKNAKTTTTAQKNELEQLKTQLAENKKMLLKTGTDIMDEIATITKNNINTMQQINTEKTRLQTEMKKIPSQLINEITSTAEMAYDLKEIESNPELKKYMQQYISKTEEKTGILASKKTINGITAFEAMIEYKKNNPSAKNILPNIIDVPIGEQTLRVEYLTTPADNPMKSLGIPEMPKIQQPQQPKEETTSLSKYIQDNAKLPKNKQKTAKEIAELFYKGEDNTTINYVKNNIQTLQNELAKRGTPEYNYDRDSVDWSAADRLELNLVTGERILNPSMSKGTPVKIYGSAEKVQFRTIDGKQVKFIDGIQQTTRTEQPIITPSASDIIGLGLANYFEPTKTFKGITGQDAIRYISLKQEEERAIKQAEEEYQNYILGGETQAPIKVTVTKTYDTLKYEHEPALIDTILDPLIDAADWLWKNDEQNLMSDGILKQVYYKQPRISTDLPVEDQTASLLDKFITASKNEFNKIQFAYADLTSNTPEEAMKKKFDILDKQEAYYDITQKGIDLINQKTKTGLDISNTTELQLINYATKDQIDKFNDKTKFGLTVSAITANKMKDAGYTTESFAGKLDQDTVQDVLNTTSLTTAISQGKELISPQTGLTDNKMLDYLLLVGTGGFAGELSGGTIKTGLKSLSKLSKIGERVAPGLKDLATFVKTASLTMPNGMELKSVSNLLSNAALSSSKVANIGIIPDSGIIARAVNSPGIPSDLTKLGKKVDDHELKTFATTYNKALDLGITNDENAIKYTNLIATGDPLKVNAILVEQISTNPGQLFGVISKGVQKLDPTTAVNVWEKLADANKAYGDLSLDFVAKTVDDAKGDTIKIGITLKNMSDTIGETSIENMINTAQHLGTEYYNDIINGTEEWKKLVINDAVKIPDIKPLGASQPGTPFNTALIIADTLNVPNNMKEYLVRLRKDYDTIEDVIRHIDASYSTIKESEHISTTQLDKIKGFMNDILDKKKNTLTKQTETPEIDIRTGAINPKTGETYTMMEEYGKYDETFKKWPLDWEIDEGIRLDTNTGKWTSKSTVGMTNDEFNKFVDGISQTTLRDMEITDLPALSNDPAEDTIRRRILELAQKEASEGASLVPEMKIIVPGPLKDYYVPKIEFAEVLRKKVTTDRAEEDLLLQAEDMLAARKPKTKLSPTQIDEQEEFIEDIQATGMLPGGTEVIASDIPTMSIIGKDIKSTSTAIQVGLPEGIWTEPTKLPTSSNDALALTNKYYDEIKLRETEDLAPDIEKALNGDIDAINRVYNKDPVLGSMIDTRSTTLAHANSALGNTEMSRAMNAVKNRRDNQAALLFNRMDQKSSLEGYVKSGYFDDVTMADLQRLEKSGVSPEMTTKLMIQRSDAATKALGKENKSIEFKLRNGDTDFTTEELKIMTNDKNLANAIDATWNPIGKQTNIIEDAMRKTADDVSLGKMDVNEGLREIERLEGLKAKARELVC